MSTVIEDQAIINGLRALMKQKKVSVKKLADGIGVPYRTLQNYLTGQARFPASVFLTACQFLGLDASYVLSNSFELSHWDLVDAMLAFLKPLLRRVKVDTEGNIIEIMDNQSEDDTHANVTSAIIASRISKEYARYRLDTLLKGNARRPPPRISDFEK